MGVKEIIAVFFSFNPWRGRVEWLKMPLRKDVMSGKMEREERKKSLSIRVKFQPSEKTLNDAEIEKMCANIISEVGEKVSGMLKS